MANIKAGTAYVDIKLGSVEDLKRKLKKEMEDAGRESGKDGGESFSDEFTETIKKKVKVKVEEEIVEVAKKSGKRGGETAQDNFQKSFAERVGRSAALLRGNLIAVLLPVVIAMGPFIGGALGGAILAALPLGVIAGGIALIAKDPQIETAGKQLGATLLKGLKDSAGVLIQPVLAAIDLIKQRFPELLKPIQGMFLAVNQFIIPLANSIINFLKPLLEGINVALQKSGPIFQVFLKGLERLGVVLGDFFKKLASDPEAIEGMADALDDLFGILVLVIKWFGDFIVSASKAYAQWKDAWGALKSWFSGTIVPSLKRALDQLKSALGAVGDFFKAWWQRLKDVLNGSRQTLMTFGTQAMATIRTFISNAVATFGQLPGKISAAIGNLGQRLYNTGVNAIQGLLNGFASLIPTLLGRARNLANELASTIANALKVGSPSKVMEEIGMWTGKGFEIGLTDSFNAISLPKPIQQITGNYGSMSEPQMDKGTGGAGINIGTYVANDNMDPWRQAEDWYFMITARGGVA